MVLTVNVGAKRYTLSVADNDQVNDLMEAVAASSQIKKENQKLIFKGVTLTKDPEKLLSDFGVKNGSKIMAIGKRYDEEEEAALRTFIHIDNEVMKMKKLTSTLEEQVDSITKGFLQKEFKSKAFEKIKKDLQRSTNCSMKHLETIDSMPLAPEFKEAKVKRKSIVEKLQNFMDHCESIISMIEES